MTGTETYDMTCDAENHLTQVKLNGTLQATMTYDGDGKRVVSTVTGGNTIRFIGDYYEYRSSTSIDKYYFAGGQRVAMRDSGVLTYIMGDHLGSTSVTTNTSGAFTSELRYKAFGDTRYTSGGIPTRYRFTGQRSYTPDFGLYYYGSRWYDPALGRFIQPDTIVPDPSNPQDLNRFSYVRNNPLRYTDPSGHMLDDGCRDYGCNFGTSGPTSGGTSTTKKKPGGGDSASTPIATSPSLCSGLYTCQLLLTEPEGVTPSLAPDIVVGDDEFTDFGPEDPPTVNGQTFTPTYGARQRGVAGLELFMMAFEFLHYSMGFYSWQNDSNAQGVILVVHNNTSGIDIYPVVAVYNNTEMILEVGSVNFNGNYLPISGSPIPNGGIGAVQFSNPPVMLTTDMSVEINFGVFQGNGTFFGYGQIRYEGPNYKPIYGPPLPP